MLVIHDLEFSRSQRVVWALEELGVEYQVKTYRRDPVTYIAPPELKAIHPLGKAPVITDGDLTIAETGAILEYLVERYGKGGFAPKPGTPERLRYTYWMHYAEGSLMTVYLMALVTGMFGGGPGLVEAALSPEPGAPKIPADFVPRQLTLHLDFVNAELDRSPWFAGQELTAADANMLFPVQLAERMGQTATRPNLAAFLARVQQRPAFQRAMKRCGAV
jgi:glutathione S-transferase